MKTELLGPLEKQIMDILWTADNPLKPCDVQSLLKEGYAYTTVMTILKRLTDKKYVCRQLSGNVYLYSACTSKEEFVKTNLSGIFNGLVNSYGKLAISQFVDTLKTDPSDLKLLQDYLKNKS
jgi:predicted transcriptional regulator